MFLFAAVAILRPLIDLVSSSVGVGDGRVRISRHRAFRTRATFVRHSLATVEPIHCQRAAAGPLTFMGLVQVVGSQPNFEIDEIYLCIQNTF